MWVELDKSDESAQEKCIIYSMWFAHTLISLILILYLALRLANHVDLSFFSTVCPKPGRVTVILSLYLYGGAATFFFKHYRISAVPRKRITQ